eukprot:CAMPEP_0174854014 /NCGR_PEP_ID=MMETSP1114-20130205/29696_1 /TAXON_ID=312471 /ORGANISM="Neobodo designis, Strain CCAP 1951/1" /LENGTH=295 /DNA_ID=CAMNT_0016088687 /DNA_START=35 /DNA_END=922 /DNA_ORIENTATION=+
MSSPRGVLSQPTMSRAGTSFAKGSDIRAQASFRRKPSDAKRQSTAGTAGNPKSDVEEKRKKLASGSHVQRSFFSCCSGGDVAEDPKPEGPADTAADAAPPHRNPATPRAKPAPLHIVPSEDGAPDDEPNSVNRELAENASPSSAWTKDPSTLTRKSSILDGKPPTPKAPLGRVGSFGPKKPPTPKSAKKDDPPTPMRRLSSKSSLQQSPALGRKGSFAGSPRVSSTGASTSHPNEVPDDDLPPSATLVRRSSSFVMPSANAAPASPRPPLGARPPSASGHLKKGKNSSIVSGVDQ